MERVTGALLVTSDKGERSERRGDEGEKRRRSCTARAEADAVAPSVLFSRRAGEASSSLWGLGSAREEARRNSPGQKSTASRRGFRHVQVGSDHSTARAGCSSETLGAARKQTTNNNVARSSCSDGTRPAPAAGLRRTSASRFCREHPLRPEKLEARRSSDGSPGVRGVHDHGHQPAREHVTTVA